MGRATRVFIFSVVAVIVGAIHFVVHDARLTPQYQSTVSVANVAHEGHVHYGTVENLVPQTKEIGRERIKVENGVAGVAQIAAAQLKATNTTQPPSITLATLMNSSPTPSTFPTQQSMNSSPAPSTFPTQQSMNSSPAPSTFPTQQSMNSSPAPSTFPTQQSMQHPSVQWSQLQAPPSLPWYKSDVKVNPEQIMQFRWVQKLCSFLTTVDRRFPIAIVASNSKYTDALLNWLIASVVKLKDPIKNILVLSLDSSLRNLLQMRRIDFLYVLPSTLANIKRSKRQAIKQVEVVRLTVMRILNHWGFDVVNYDSDAVILRNPQPIYDRYPGSDVIGSAGTFPNGIYIKWGVTVCMGVVMIRATNRTGIHCL